MKIQAILFAALLITGCYPTTRVTGSWKNPQITRSYHHIFVAALTGNTVARSTLENEIAAALNKKGLTTVKSVDALPPSYNRDSIAREDILRKVREQSSEAILTVSVLKRETESRYVSGGYAPMSRWDYYNNFGGYYSYWYPAAYSPGYYQNDQVYYLETNLYDAQTEKLIWSAQSRTYSFNDLPSLAREYAIVITDQMTREQVLQ